MIVRWRSVLFAPGGRPDLVAKLPRAGADTVVIDLEDGVPADSKDMVRASLQDLVGSIAGARCRTLVRVNASASEWFDDDIRAAAMVSVHGVVVPKVETPEQIDAVRGRIPDGWAVLVGLETAMGVHRAVDVLGAGPDAAYFGAADYITALGGVRTTRGDEVLYARSHVALAGRLARVPTVDQVVTAIRDGDAFRRDALAGRAIGYAGKLCLHPDQVAIAHECFSVTEEQLDWACRVLAIAERESADGRGVFAVDGQMVDEPMLRQARQWVAQADDDRRGDQT